MNKYTYIFLITFCKENNIELFHLLFYLFLAISQIKTTLILSV